MPIIVIIFTNIAGQMCIKATQKHLYIQQYASLRSAFY